MSVRPVRVSERNHGTKGGQVGEHVAREVQHHAARRHRANVTVLERSDPDQHVAGLGYAGIGEQPLQIALVNRDQIANGHRQRSEHRKHRQPGVNGRQQRSDQETHYQREPRRFGPDGQIGRDRCRGTFVDIRRPHMEGDGPP